MKKKPTAKTDVAPKTAAVQKLAQTKKIYGETHPHNDISPYKVKHS